MYALGISLAVGLVVFGIIAAWLGPLAAIVPGVGVALVGMFLISRQVGQRVEAAMAAIAPLLQNRRIKEAEAHIRQVQKQYGPWQFLLAGQLDAQLGMIEYMQMHWDKALPLLQSGQFRNWTALVCIGCVHYRKGRKEQAWEAFEKAASASSKEVVIYGIWAHLLVKDGKRTEALEAVSKGLKAQPESQALKDLKQRIANKKKVNAKAFGEVWFQFFPEELRQQALVRGRGNQAQMQSRLGARHAPRR